MDKFGLQFLQARFRLLTFGQIADEAGEKTPVTGFHFAYGELHRKGRAVLALADHDPANTDDTSLACRSIALQVTIVAFTIGFGHQDSYILTDCLGRS